MISTEIEAIQIKAKAFNRVTALVAWAALGYTARIIAGARMAGLGVRIVGSAAGGGDSGRVGSLVDVVVGAGSGAITASTMVLDGSVSKAARR